MINRRVIVPLVFSLFAASPLFAITRTWAGTVSANWSDPANWSPSGTPAPVDALVFPAQVPNRAMNNDLPAGTTIGGMSVFDQYILGGNPLTLSGDVSVSANGLGLTLNPDVKLGGPVKISNSSGYVRFTGDLNVNGQALTLASGTTYIHGTLSGTGSINGSGGLQIAAGGSFSGTIQALYLFNGSLPNATVVTTSLDAVGTLGDVNASLVIAGTSAGVLHTKSVVLKSLSIDLYPPDSDQLKVNGTVTLQGPLTVRNQSGLPFSGQSYTIIDNDGNDPVIGTFTGLPEGAFAVVDGYSLQISYVGGDGNDVVLTAVTPNKEWTGSVSGSWSDGRNWTPQSAPTAGQVLVFPHGPSNRTMTNDLPAGMSVGAMTFYDDYILAGNALTLTGDLGVSSTSNPYPYGQGVTLNLNASLGGPIQIAQLAGPSYVRFTGDVNMNAQTLTLAGGTTFLHGTVSGTGSIAKGGTGSASLQIAAGGSFNGSIGTPLHLFSGSLPNATVTTSSLDAVGTLGDLSASLTIADTSAGVLHTKSVLLNGLTIDIYSPNSDQLKAIGTVAVDGALTVRVPGGQVIPGQSYVIIDNDGTDPVTGTFTGLPEGATVIGYGYAFKISYAGGDGNDVVLTAALSDKVWTGAVSGAWSDGRNWSPQGVPSSGQVLVFPDGAANRAMTNDLPAGTSVAMRFFDSYIIGGNTLTLAGDLDVGGLTYFQGVTLNLNVRLGGPLRISDLTGRASYVRFVDDLNINGQTLTAASGTTYIHGTLSGSGSITDAGTFAGYLQIAGGGSFSGSIRKALSFSGSLPNATVETGNVNAVGTVGDLTMPLTLGGFLSIADASAGVLHTKSVNLAIPLNIDLNPAASSDQLQVNGTVTLRGGLQAQLVGTPALGQNYVIIDNDGTDAINGTFVGLPEGAVIVLNGFSFQISYAGGDGNDVVLRVVQATSAALSQGTNQSVFGQPVTLTAVVTSSAGTPTGTVFFTANGVSLGTAPLVNGVASIASTALPTGTNNIVAAIHGTGVFADTTSNFVSHVVVRGQTAVTVVSDRQDTLFGATVRFTAAVSPVAPAAGAPAGMVNFFADGVAIGMGQLVAGTATLETSALHAGLSSITATYAGDANFAGSTASAIQQNVIKAQTAVDAQFVTPMLVGQSSPVTVYVYFAPPSALVPSGVVSISEGGTLLASHLLAGGGVNFILNPFAAGNHTLVVSYSGDADSEASSETIVLHVIAPAVSIQGAHVVEGNNGTTSVSLVATLSAPVSQTVRVSFSTLNGSATEGEDYEKSSGVIEFAPGEVTRAIELHIFGDVKPESDETFSIVLSDPVNATIDTPSAMIVIVNDDPYPPRRRPSRP